MLTEEEIDDVQAAIKKAMGIWELSREETKQLARWALQLEQERDEDRAELERLRGILKEAANRDNPACVGATPCGKCWRCRAGTETERRVQERIQRLRQRDQDTRERLGITKRKRGGSSDPDPEQSVAGSIDVVQMGIRLRKLRRRVEGLREALESLIAFHERQHLDDGFGLGGYSSCDQCDERGPEGEPPAHAEDCFVGQARAVLTGLEADT